MDILCMSQLVASYPGPIPAFQCCTLKKLGGPGTQSHMRDVITAQCHVSKRSRLEAARFELSTESERKIC